MPWLVAAGITAVGLFLVLMWRIGSQVGSPRQARALFQAQRQQLEARFFEAASASGKPRGLRWKACAWEPGVELARERSTGRLLLLVGVTIQFEAVEGSDMEGLPAVGNLRNASAVFFFHGGQWHTTGRAVFNLNPDEALAHFQNQYEPLGPG